MWDFSGLSVSFDDMFYNNAAKIFGTEGVLRRRLENVESKMVHTTRGKCSIYKASRVSDFFVVFFFVPKIVPKKLPAFCIPLVYLWYRIGIASSSAKVAQG